MLRLTSRADGRTRWLPHLTRCLVLVAQLLVLLVPLSEGREQRLLDPHVEAPRTTLHLGHHADVCPACTLAGMHGCAEEPPALDLPVAAAACLASSVPLAAVQGVRTRSHSSRAPPRPA
jgi:hypothetical protein